MCIRDSARTFFEELNIDSVTVAPYMGEDSVTPVSYTHLDVYKRQVNQLERIAVWQQFADTVYIHYRLTVTVVTWRLYFVQTDFFPHLACKLIIDRDVYKRQFKY